MPKRSAQEKIDNYQKKIRRLETKKKIHKRVISSDDDQGIEESRQVQIIEDIPTEKNDIQIDKVITSEPDAVPDLQATDPVLNPELLQALGEPSSDSPDYGLKILESQAKLWLPILRKGLNKEPKDNLLKQYLIPDNCRLLHAPKLNAEIAAAIPDMVRNRDKNTMCTQQQ